MNPLSCMAGNASRGVIGGPIPVVVYTVERLGTVTGNQNVYPTGVNDTHPKRAYPEFKAAMVAGGVSNAGAIVRHATAVSQSPWNGKPRFARL